MAPCMCVRLILGFWRIVLLNIKKRVYAKVSLKLKTKGQETALKSVVFPNPGWWGRTVQVVLPNLVLGSFSLFAKISTWRSTQ